MVLIGLFPDLIGLSYQCGQIDGVTGPDYTYSYDVDTPVSFKIGNVSLGSSTGKPLMNVLDLVTSDAPVSDPRVINRARLLYSLSSGQGFEVPITITDSIREVVSKYSSRIDLDAKTTSDLDEVLTVICTEVNLVPKSVAHVRNHLRRAAAGFKVLRDLCIPVKDGAYVLGDVYLPLDIRRSHPVLVSCTMYGRRVVASGPDVADPDDVATFEKCEDDWHSTGVEVELPIPHQTNTFQSWTHQRGFENIATFNTFTFVPHGYAMLKIEARGVSQTPGTRGVPGQLESDYRDAIEWAAKQPWSNGSIALAGSSQGGNLQWQVARMRPQGLKCFVPYTSDLDLYRDAAYIGGIPSERFLADWTRRVREVSHKWPEAMALEQLVKAHPFQSDLWQKMSAPSGNEGLPCFLGASQIFMIHGRGAYEAWRVRNHDITNLQLVDCNYYPWPSNQASGKILAFLDKYLKGKETALEKVGIQVRMGHGQWYWRTETDWPVPGTEYVRWHLRADGSLSRNPEDGASRVFSYSSRLPPSGQKAGVSFLSPPMEHDTDLAGHFLARLSISSSLADADVVVNLWPVDGGGRIVPFSSSNQPEPIAKGFLRASHRATDPEKSLPERPWHTHTLEDHAPLKIDEVVSLDVEIMPAAAKIRQGWSLRLDIGPQEEQPDIPGYNPHAMRIWYGEEHEEGTNSVHVGSNLENYISCPVVLCKEGKLGQMD